MGGRSAVVPAAVLDLVPELIIGEDPAEAAFDDLEGEFVDVVAIHAGHAIRQDDHVLARASISDDAVSMQAMRKGPHLTSGSKNALIR